MQEIDSLSFKHGKHIRPSYSVLQLLYCFTVQVYSIILKNLALTAGFRNRAKHGRKTWLAQYGQRLG